MATENAQDKGMSSAGLMAKVICDLELFHCTLNEVRVMNQIILCSLHGRTCSVTDLHKVTGIPMPTVSRAVANLHLGGWLSEQQDPNDGRRLIITLGPRSLQDTSDGINRAIRWINDFREHGLTT